MQDNWLRKVTITRADLASGDWQSRDRNPVALAIARVLRPGTTLLVDVGHEEYFLAQGTHREWFGLPDEFLAYAVRVQNEASPDELTVEMRFPPWALPTERWARKQARP